MLRKYHTLLSKPIDLFSSNVLVYSSIELLSLSSQYFSWPLGIILTTSAIRVLSTPISYYLDKVNWVLPKAISPSAQKFYSSFFLNNLEADVKKLKITESQHGQLQGKIAPNVIMRQLIQSYLLLGYARGLHQISFNPQYYEGMQNVYFGYFQLCASDPTFLLPIGVGLVTYQVLTRTKHPFTLTLSENSSFWISFATSIFFIPLPISYILAYSSFASTHILLNSKGS